jgi:hypothetical protein
MLQVGRPSAFKINGTALAVFPPPHVTYEGEDHQKPKQSDYGINDFPHRVDPFSSDQNSAACRAAMYFLS